MFSARKIGIIHGNRLFKPPMSSYPGNCLLYKPLSSTRKSWVPITDEKLQQVTTQSYIHEISEQQRQSTLKAVPWFLKSMPASYFRTVPEPLRAQHLKAIVALRDLMQSDLSLKIENKELDGALEVTFINSQTKTGLLHAQLKTLVVPDGYELSKVNVFSSLDEAVALNIFSFENTQRVNVTATPEDSVHILDYAKELQSGQHLNDVLAPRPNKLFDEANLKSYFERISPSYARSSTPRRFLVHRELYEKVYTNDGTAVHIELHPDSVTGLLDKSTAWVTIAAANVLPEVLLRLCSAIITARKLNISKASLDSIASPENSTPEIAGQVTMLRLLVSAVEPNVDLSPGSDFGNTLSRDLKRAKWLDNQTTDLGLVNHPTLGLDKAEIITALCAMLHGPLSKENSQQFASIKSILQTLESTPVYLGIATNIAQLFLDRFRPTTVAGKTVSALSENEFTTRSGEIFTKISLIQHDAGKLLLTRMLEATRNTLRTNFYRDDRYALSLRVRPNLMMSAAQDAHKPEPFGVLFVHGRHFNGFHCRFRDIARGGLRIVTPPNSDQYAIESSKQFDEAYNLSYAQQLKNKDIPEGGAKAVILVNTPIISSNSRFFAMRKSVKSFSDSLLDLIVKDSVVDLVDFYGKDELIYLGPDEQVIPSDIEWIVNRAAQRGYPIPAAFMSSKKDAGFNHKEFGVTSEGVVVYLDVALQKALKIDPRKDPFTVKITGGPDGDVAGNLMKILFREYGSNCKILGVADGLGVAEDPEGLNPTELLRLVDQSLSITHFNKSALSKDGVVLPITTDAGMARRNTMHFRVKSDAFIPAGGRPNTINIDNYKQFIDDKGEPSSPLIVEGANIFITNEARQALFDNGKVVIVKDSSANKCGVITSSFEIAASMLITKEEFMAIKPKLVEDVLDRLRYLARLEGELLFRVYANFPGALPHFSERISLAIAKVTDAITDALSEVQPEDPLFKELLPLIEENLPKKLAEVAKDRISDRLPVQYQRNAIASTLASKLVYQEGIHLIESQPYSRIAERAFMYYREEQKIQTIIKKIENDFGGSGPFLDEKDAYKREVLDILKRGGTRTSLNIF
eukprot:gene10640-14290_t